MLALDLFCCAGGASRGLSDAGFDVVGVDIKRHKHYPYRWIERDLSTAAAVLDVIREVGPDFVAASPPCQAFSVVTPEASRGLHRNLIPTTREAIEASGVPGWIENVHGAPLHHPIRLCGSMFPETQSIRRHRYFDLIGWFTMEPPHDTCTFLPYSIHNGSIGSNQRKALVRRETTQVFGHGAPGRMYRKRVTVAGRGANGGNPAHQTAKQRAELLERNNAGPECIRWRTAMGWLDGPRDRYGLAQAIPPAYARWLGERFLSTRSVRA